MKLQCTNRNRNRIAGSAPTRGPWIEIKRWNAENTTPEGRPPHGGRGLKFTIWWNLILLS